MLGKSMGVDFQLSRQRSESSTSSSAAVPDLFFPDEEINARLHGLWFEDVGLFWVWPQLECLPESLNAKAGTDGEYDTGMRWHRESW